MSSESVILVTGAIVPPEGSEYLVLTDKNARLNQYVFGLRQLINANPCAKVVFCENTNYGAEAFEDVVLLTKKSGLRFETLSYKGDLDKVRIYGKGYGEGEIIKYALANSKFITDNDYLFKLTGRLCVDNIADIVKVTDKSRIYFNIPNIHRRDIYDTRFYGMPIKIYKDYFVNAYKKVNDTEGYYIENVYTDVIINNRLCVRNFPKYPRIVGQSGTYGTQYSYCAWKTQIKDLLSIFNVYGKIHTYKT